MKFLGYEFKKIGTPVVEKQLLTNESQIISHLGNYDFGDMVFGKNVETAMKYEVLDTGLRFLSNCFTQLDFTVVDDKGKNVDHDILYSLTYPNTLQKRNDLLFQWCYYLLADGRVFQSIKQKSIVNKYDFELINLNPDNLKTKKPRKSILDLTYDDISIFYNESFSGIHSNIKTQLNKDLLIRYADGVSVNNVDQCSLIDSLKNEIKNIEIAKKAKQNKLKLSGGIIGTPKTSSNSNEMVQKMTDTVNFPSQGDSHKSLSEKRLRASGLYGEDHVKLMTIAMEFHSLTKDLNDLDFDKEVINDYRKVYRKIGIPEHLTGLSENGLTYENQQTALVQLYQSKIQNLADLYSSGINDKFFKDEKLTLKAGYKHLPIFAGLEKESQECEASDMRMRLELLDRNLITEDDFKNRFQL